MDNFYKLADELRIELDSLAKKYPGILPWRDFIFDVESGLEAIANFGVSTKEAIDNIKQANYD